MLDGCWEGCDNTTPHHHVTPLPLLCLQEKANQEAAAAKAAAKDDPLAAAPTQQRHEVWVTKAGRAFLQGPGAVQPCLEQQLLTASCLERHWCCRCVAAVLQDFPPLPADGQVKQRNEGRWDFTLQESEDG